MEIIIQATNDGSIEKVAAVYADAHDAVAGDSVITTDIRAGQSKATNYAVERSFLSFANIINCQSITAVSLFLHGSANYSTTDFDGRAWTSLYSDPLAVGDFPLTYVTDLLTGWNSSSYSATWNEFVFSAGGIAAVFAKINSTFKMRMYSDNDLDNVAPTGDELVIFKSHTTAGQEPYLKITYIPFAPTTAPTNVAATKGVYSDKVRVTWTKVTGATGYKIKRDSVLVETVGDVAVWDDTGADSPVITPGATVASDGTQFDGVDLSLSGASIANGTTHTYTVAATNEGGDSAYSDPDTGYKVAGTLTYQWQHSAADSDASYSDISGATYATWQDSTPPNTGDGRYFKCKVDAVGSTQAISTPDRGYRKPAVFWLKIHPYQVWRGVWDTQTEYIEGDVVVYGDGDLKHAFMSKTGHNLGNLPTDITHWVRLIQEGWKI